MVNGEYDNWKVSQSKFQGYMKAKLEGMEKTLDNINETDSSQDVRLDNLETSRDKFKGAMLILTFIWGAIVLAFNKYLR